MCVICREIVDSEWTFQPLCRPLSVTPFGTPLMPSKHEQLSTEFRQDPHIEILLGVSEMNRLPGHRHGRFFQPF